MNLWTIIENYTNGYTIELLDAISLLAILCGVLVIINKNPVVSILFLIGLFANISCYLIMIGLTFIGLSYLIVYIGAVSILFLFILMLINIRVSELQSSTINSIPLALIIAVYFNYPILQILPYNKKDVLGKADISTLQHSQDIDTIKVDYVTSKAWDSNLIENSHITSIGNVLYTNYNIWLILASFILLLAMVGAIVITIKQKQ